MPCEDPLLVGGLDPSGGKGRWGYALLECRLSLCRIASSGEVSPRRSWESIKPLAKARFVGVDAPLTLAEKSYRECDRVAALMGARLLPLTLWGMRKLSLVGFSISMLLIEAGSIPVETHPRSFRENTGLQHQPPLGMGRHEWDAVTSALAAYALASGRPLIAVSDECIMVLGLDPPARVSVSEGVGGEVILEVGLRS